MTKSEAGKLGQQKSAQTMSKQKEARMKAYAENPKKCEVCKTPLAYRDHTRKRFCSRRCSSLYTKNSSARKKIKYCAGCESQLKSSRGKYCSPLCQPAHKRRLSIEKWLRGESNGKYVPSGVWAYLYNLHGGCEKCGWNEINPKTGKTPLQIDHINGNPTDHSPGNLRLLCPNCHSLTPTYGNLNRGKGRKWRYQNMP